MTQHAAYGPVHGPPTGEMGRRGFMRRVLGVGVGILSLEFIAGSIAFLYLATRRKAAEPLAA